LNHHAGLAGEFVHPRSGSEIVGILGATVEHEHQGAGRGRDIGGAWRHVELVGEGAALMGEAARGPAFGLGAIGRPAVGHGFARRGRGCGGLLVDHAHATVEHDRRSRRRRRECARHESTMTRRAGRSLHEGLELRHRIEGIRGGRWSGAVRTLEVGGAKRTLDRLGRGLQLAILGHPGGVGHQALQEGVHGNLSVRLK
jgi:hypothetical protein